MSRSGGAQITGLREVVRSLERYGVDAQDLKQAFGEISREVVTDAAALVKVVSGDLQGTIRAANTKNKSVVRAGSARAPYAGVINYGWPDRGIAESGFLTTPANTDLDAKVARIEHNLEALIKRHRLA